MVAALALFEKHYVWPSKLIANILTVQFRIFSAASNADFFALRICVSLMLPLKLHGMSMSPIPMPSYPCPFLHLFPINPEK